MSAAATSKTVPEERSHCLFIMVFAANNPPPCVGRIFVRSPPSIIPLTARVPSCFLVLIPLFVVLETMSNSSAARTNLTSKSVNISDNILGVGSFRICVEGTYVGGNRNGQEAACKRFKPHLRQMEDEFFAKDFQIADRTILYAEGWNAFCDHGKEIIVSRGDIHTTYQNVKYLVEPLVRHFEKFTSNNGWIASVDDVVWAVLAMEAFSHYTYHQSGGQMIVCDLQGRYRFNKFNRNKSRFELSDPAICSRRRTYGPTDLGEKGIESFFFNHSCNGFCQSHWHRPRNPEQWFPLSRGTSMLSSQMTNHLMLTSPTKFHTTLMAVQEYDDDSDY